MICRFCSQWNPPEATRCTFCDNPMEAEEDTTISGQKSLAKRGLADPNVQIRLTQPPASPFRSARKEGPQVNLHLTPQTVKILGGIVALLVVLVGWCSS